MRLVADALSCAHSSSLSTLQVLQAIATSIMISFEVNHSETTHPHHYIINGQALLVGRRKPYAIYLRRVLDDRCACSFAQSILPGAGCFWHAQSGQLFQTTTRSARHVCKSFELCQRDNAPRWYVYREVNNATRLENPLTGPPLFRQ